MVVFSSWCEEIYFGVRPFLTYRLARSVRPPIHLWTCNSLLARRHIRLPGLPRPGFRRKPRSTDIGSRTVADSFTYTNALHSAQLVHLLRREWEASLDLADDTASPFHAAWFPTVFSLRHVLPRPGADSTESCRRRRCRIAGQVSPRCKAPEWIY